MFGVNPWVILGVFLAFVASNAGSYFEGKNVGIAQRIAIENAQVVGKQAKTIKHQAAAAQINTNIGAKVDHDKQDNGEKTRVILRTITVHIPPSADPFVSCGFVRVHDLAVSGGNDTIVCAGKLDNAPSDVRLSEAAALLTTNYGKCKDNADQLSGWIAWFKAQQALEKTDVNSGK